MREWWEANSPFFWGVGFGLIVGGAIATTTTLSLIGAGVCLVMMVVREALEEAS